MLRTESIAKKDHQMSDWSQRSDATCTNAEILERHCETCSTYVETKDGNPALGHDEGEWIIDEDSTCSTFGSKHIECNVCETVLRTESIAKKDHQMSDWSQRSDATCTNAEILERHCETCSTYVETKDGNPALGHDEGEWIIDKDSTCSTFGSQHKECARCKTVLATENIAKKEHVYNDSVVAPTKYAYGYTKHTCTNCSHSYTSHETYLISYSLYIVDSLADKGHAAPTLVKNEEIVYKADVLTNGFTFTDVLANKYYYTRDLSVKAYQSTATIYNLGDVIAISSSIEITINVVGLKTYKSKGLGTIESPYVIDNKYQLINLAKTSPRTTDYFIQTSDIDLDGVEWTPIGSTNDLLCFYGYYDGQNHTISNMSIQNSGLASVGLFANVSGGEISNLRLENSEIVNPSKINSNQNIGLIAAYTMNDASISNVKIINCEILINSTYTNSFKIGGLVGSVNESMLSNCIVDVALSIIPYTNNISVGGAVGDMFNSTMSSSKSQGQIEVTQKTYSGFSKIAGLVATVTGGFILNSYALVDINFNGLSSATSSYAYVAGLIAQVDVLEEYNSLIHQSTYYNMEISNNYYYGNIIISNGVDANIHKGELFAYVRIISANADYYTIKNNLTFNESNINISGTDLSTLANASNNRSLAQNAMLTASNWGHLSSAIWNVVNGNLPTLKCE